MFNQNLLPMYILWYLLIGLVVGWLANLIVRGNGSRFVLNLIAGIVGGLLGGWVVALFGWIPIGTMATFFTSLFGAILFLAIVSLFQRSDMRD